MGQLIRLIRLKLSPEDGGFITRLLDLPEAMFTGMSFHLSDGTNIRLNGELAVEMKRCLEAVAENAVSGRSVAPVEVDDAISRMHEILDEVNAK